MCAREPAQGGVRWLGWGYNGGEIVGEEGRRMMRYKKMKGGRKLKYILRGLCTNPPQARERMYGVAHGPITNEISLKSRLFLLNSNDIKGKANCLSWVKRACFSWVKDSGNLALACIEFLSIVSDCAPICLDAKVRSFNITFLILNNLSYDIHIDIIVFTLTLLTIVTFVSILLKTEGSKRGFSKRYHIE